LRSKLVPNRLDPLYNRGARKVHQIGDFSIGKRTWVVPRETLEVAGNEGD
jgi:hypothetical protein